MAGQKIEDLLNLALDATQEEREKSLELDVGYDPIEREWDVIVKYTGSLDNVRNVAVRLTDLLNEYAIVTVKESRLSELAALREVEYIEKPKRLFFQTADGRRVSCIDEVQDARFSLFGQGVLVAVIDSGIDYMLPDFRNEDGSTRILALWDQSAAPRQEEGEAPPVGYAEGTEYTRERINAAIEAPSEAQRRRIIPGTDTSGHGTSVAAIAAGNGGGESRYRGVAPRSSLLVVKLGVPRTDGFPRTTELMAGIDYAVRKSLEYRMPLVINISFGNTYGAHEPYN
ncbi:S8 family serine peptidase [Lachnoclostridium phocaeense]|uniref:S8 family serine peptidase n=1 Tax=Lachnoclostridium phocaeense TaxID=1871021 RepID=UPI002ED1E734